MKKENKLTEEKLGEVNGGYIFRTFDEHNTIDEIIRDSDGEVICSIKDPDIPMWQIPGQPLPKNWKGMNIAPVVAQAMGQSPDMISWKDLDELRRNHQ